MEPVERQPSADGSGRAVPAQLATGNRNMETAPSALAEVTPTLSIREVSISVVPGMRILSFSHRCPYIYLHIVIYIGHESS